MTDVKLVNFINSNLQKYIIDDLQRYKIHSETDLHAIIYYHLRKFTGDGADWLVRCEPTLTNWLKPDIFILHQNEPKFIAEVVFHMRDYQAEFPYRRLVDNRNKLRRIKRLKAYRNLETACLIAVYDAKIDNDESLIEDKDWEKNYYSEMFINVHEFSNYDRWKEKWAEIHSAYS